MQNKPDGKEMIASPPTYYHPYIRPGNLLAILTRLGSSILLLYLHTIDDKTSHCGLVANIQISHYLRNRSDALSSITDT